jgi:hypothetical protein
VAVAGECRGGVHITPTSGLELATGPQGAAGFHRHTGGAATEDLDGPVVGAGAEVGPHPGRDGRLVIPGDDGTDAEVAAR